MNIFCHQGLLKVCCATSAEHILLQNERTVTLKGLLRLHIYCSRLLDTMYKYVKMYVIGNSVLELHILLRIQR